MRKFKITVNGKAYEVEVEDLGKSTEAVAPKAVTTAVKHPVTASGTTPVSAAPKVAVAVPQGAASVTAPLPGTIVSVNVKVGDLVGQNDVLCVLEAMKMENEIHAPKAGKVVAVNVTKGSTVNRDDVLVAID